MCRIPYGKFSDNVNQNLILVNNYDQSGNMLCTNMSLTHRPGSLAWAERDVSRLEVWMILLQNIKKWIRRDEIRHYRISEIRNIAIFSEYENNDT
jgi:hypothetical protein